MNQITKAIGILLEAHGDGQLDKGGATYVLHPLRVGLALYAQVREAGGDPETSPLPLIGFLHDTIEDTREKAPAKRVTTESLLKAGFGAEVVEAVVALTKRPEEQDPEKGPEEVRYDRFITRVSENPLARMAKLADLEDNLDRSRIPHPTPEDEARWRKYRRARARLASCPCAELL